VLVDDQSSDGTADAARMLSRSTDRKIIVVNGASLSSGWTGKVWALHQGIAVASGAQQPPDYFLLTDADIAYQGDVLTALVMQTVKGKRALTSVMAKLNMESLAERALIPAFIFFFQMLYPFEWVNRTEAKTAAAAGGCMLVDRLALERAGGIEAIRGALIDDCALAKLLKMQGPIWLGLSQRVTSLRSYPSFETIRLMVARSAYAQLRYSPWLLAGTVFGMLLTYLAAPLLALFADGATQLAGLAAWLMMALAFQPILRLYQRSPLWGLALPIIGALYTVFTIQSAIQVWRGHGGMWKGRAQALADPA
jgi:hopene-associated glycosyltransferase HpnB